MAIPVESRSLSENFTSEETPLALPTSDFNDELGDLAYQSVVKSLTKGQFESMAGTNTKVLFEFPNETNGDGKSTFILMDSIITLSYSVYRAKMPVIPLGQTSVTGFALGTRTVAGSIIKVVGYRDELSEFMTFYRAEAIKSRNVAFTAADLGSKHKITQKDFNSIMRDDLTPFNIYTYSISEYSGKITCDAILGCTILNNSQVQSIENLITENVISFVANNVVQNYNPSLVTASFPSLSTTMTGTDLLRKTKR